jgi:hypothetical protein
LRDVPWDIRAGSDQYRKRRGGGESEKPVPPGN